jgi:predicted TIM-barrel fold metal-dependent hydrolase
LAQAKNWRVDVHHHFYPPEYLDMLRGSDSTAVFPGIRDWTIARTLEELDRSEVATAVLSLSPPGCRMGDREQNRRLARLCNEYGKRMATEHPGRFGLFGVLPLPDVQGSLAEIAHAMDVLGADGIELMTSYDDGENARWLGDPAFDPVLEELNRRKALVFVHPLAPACCADLMPWVPAAVLEFPHDTNRCIVSLLFSGALSRFPDIRFIFSHAGGAMPMLAGRAIHSGMSRRFLDKIPKGIEYELAKLHYDIALAAFPIALNALFALVPKSQVLLGSDYPFHGIGNAVSGLLAMNLPDQEVRTIFRGNAERLIPRLSSR